MTHRCTVRQTFIVCHNTVKERMGNQQYEGLEVVILLKVRNLKRSMQLRLGSNQRFITAWVEVLCSLTVTTEKQVGVRTCHCPNEV